MMDADDVVRRRNASRVLLFAALAACGVGGVLAVWNYAAAAAVAVVLLLLPVAYAVVGVQGIVLLVPVLYCFVGLSRFDEMLSIVIDARFRVPVAYWMTALSLCALVLMVPWNRYAGVEHALPEQRFARRFAGTLIALVAWSAFALVFNHLADPYVTERSVLAEVLSMGTIAFPMALVAVIPLSALSKPHCLRCIQAMIAMAAATGLIMAVFGLMPGLVTGLLGWKGAAFGTLDLARGRTPLGHPNTVAAVLQVFMGACALLGIRRKGWLARCAYLGAAGAIFFGILFSLSRTALVISGLTLLLVFVYVFLSGKKARGAEPLLIGGFFVVLICGMAYLFTMYDFSRFWSRGYHETAAIGGRMNALRTSIAIWGDHPLAGTGPGAVYPRLDSEYGWVFDGFSDEGFLLSYREHMTPPHPHNMYLLTLSEFGLLGAPLVFLLIGYAGQMLLGLRKRLGAKPIDAEFVTATLFGFTAMLLSGAVESLFLINIRHGVIVWIFLGLAIRYGIAATEEETQAELLDEGARP